jgi:hypothetical protein
MSKLSMPRVHNPLNQVGLKNAERKMVRHGRNLGEQILKEIGNKGVTDPTSRKRK